MNKIHGFLSPDVYGTVKRGITERRLIPWGIQLPEERSRSQIVPHNDFSVAGSKMISENPARTYFDFQNQSAVEMRINFGAPASASVGIVVPAGGTRIFDAANNIGVVLDTIHVFCVSAGNAFAWSEA